MPDFPAHAAALFVQTHAAPGSLLSRFYEIDWAPVPDLASELIVPLFASVVSVITATKLFICMALLLWVFGPAAVQYALSGRVAVTSLAAALFAYNANFTMGFINFYFAAGGAFFVIAAWIATEPWLPVARFVMLAGCFALLYFLHLLAMPFAGLVLCCFELAKLRRRDPEKTRKAIRNLLIVCAAVVPVVVCAVLFPAGHASDGETYFDLPSSIPTRLGSLNWIGFAPETIVLAALAAWAIAAKRAQIDPRMGLALIALLAISLILPKAFFGAWGLHIRYPAMGAALLFAALSLRLSRRAAVLAIAATVTASAADAATLVWFWRGPDAQIREMRGALNQLAPGSKVFIAMDGVKGDADYRHVPEYAVIDRSAFVPLLFTMKNQHIVHTRPAWQSLAAANAVQAEVVTFDDLAPLARAGAKRPDLSKFFPYLMQWPCNFDDVLLLRLTGKPAPTSGNLIRLSEGDTFTLYAINRPSSCSNARV